MAADVTFVKGNVYANIDYTPAAGDVALGTVVVIGTVTSNTGGAAAIACVASHAITNNIQGALDAGGGQYQGLNLNNAANGAKVYWDDTNNKFTTASTNNAVFGTIVKNGGGGANTNCIVLHNPIYGGN
jgi:hypothetical protein